MNPPSCVACYNTNPAYNSVTNPTVFHLNRYYKDDTTTARKEPTPPPSDDDDDSETVEINGQRVKKTEKVLVERDGKFELVQLGELEAILPPLKPAPVSISPAVTSSPDKAGGDADVSKLRPKSAPIRKRKPHPPRRGTRPKSAFNDGRRPVRRSFLDYLKTNKIVTFLDCENLDLEKLYILIHAFRNQAFRKPVLLQSTEGNADTNEYKQADVFKQY